MTLWGMHLSLHDDKFVFNCLHLYRSVIERDMCTYCRKPLGTETKMILDELQICCHSTCFKVRTCLLHLAKDKIA